MSLLWQEYLQIHADGYRYSQFCEHYRQWAGKLPISMRQSHVAGQKTFIDYSGDKISIVDRMTGEILGAEIFIAVLGASSFTYAEATWTQTLSDWIASHVRAFEYFQGVSEILVPDNLKSGVKKPNRYEPELNRIYQDMATHYGCAIIPARVQKPKDKALAEIGVLLAQRWILAALRHRTFYSLVEANEAIWEMFGAYPVLTETGGRIVRALRWLLLQQQYEELRGLEL